MKARSAAIQGGLAAIGLVAAYVTWQSPKDTSKASGVTIVDAAKNSLERVRYEDGTRAVTLEKKDRFLVTLAYLPGKRPVFDAGVSVTEVDGGVDAGTVLANVKPAELPDRTVFANDRADTVWAKLTPFEGTRALGKLPDAKLEEVGLTKSDRKLELTVAGQTRRFTISRPVGGLIGNYAQDEKSGEVFLISSSLFNDLDPNSQLLVDRRLHLFKPTEFDGFTVKANDKQQAFVQTGADIAQTTKVARAATPDKADELVKNWHEKIWNRIIVTDVLEKGEVPKAGEPAVRMRLDYTLKGQPKGWLELGFDSTGGTWARSENTPGWVAVHQGTEELVIEGAKLLE
ncbi:MAG: hypothetical protein ACOZQL_35575 [Myxococcota bacterium]